VTVTFTGLAALVPPVLGTGTPGTPPPAGGFGVAVAPLGGGAQFGNQLSVVVPLGVASRFRTRTISVGT
jgi:hypothetical protein